MNHVNTKKRFAIGFGMWVAVIVGLMVTMLTFSVVNHARSATSISYFKSLGGDPGLVITGYVRLNDNNGAGLENVTIYRNYAAYPGDQIALTDLQGYYDSGFYIIPGMEMVTVWGEKPGYNIEPQQYHWAHYYGYERRELDFVAKPLVTNCTTPPLPNRIFVNRGSWNTNELNHQLNITLGDGAEVITVTSEAGMIVETGNLLPSTVITIPLQPNTLNHLKVDGKFELVSNCYYVTTTEYDYSGYPLTINQQLPQKYYLPIIAN